MKIKSPPIRSDKKVYAFCDESSHTKHKYFVVGALYFIPDDPERGDKICAEIEKSLQAEKERFRLFSQLKWDKVPNKGNFFEGYKNPVEC